MMRIDLKEHDNFEEKLNDEQLEAIKNLGLCFAPPTSGEQPRYLGISSSQASYYIGACWLSETEKIFLTVLPKMENIDFLKMFVQALKNQKSAKYFSSCYGINFSKPAISIDASNDILSPLLIVHFVFAMESLLRFGLKKDYMTVEENLKSKARGRIKFIQNERKNTFYARNDRIFCQFSEYTADTVENRLLKRALVFSKQILSSLESLRRNSCFAQLNQKTNGCLSRFENISDEIKTSAIISIKQNKLYRHYNEAIKIAKMILRRCDNSLAKIKEKEALVPEFWIDMPRLYEVYVYSKLLETYGGKIQFQASGCHGTQVDFIKTDERIILDAKYKPRYADTNKRIIDDIRQLSGYARDEKILRTLGVKDENYIPPCVIIYPEKTVLENDEKDESLESLSFEKNKSIIEQCSQIKCFRKFYKIGVPLPLA